MTELIGLIGLIKATKDTINQARSIFEEFNRLKEENKKLIRNLEFCVEEFDKCETELINSKNKFRDKDFEAGALEIEIEDLESQIRSLKITNNTLNNNLNKFIRKELRERPQQFNRILPDDIVKEIGKF